MDQTTWNATSTSEERVVPSSQIPIVGPWSWAHDDTTPSSCDSSSCTYCHSMVSRRRMDAAGKSVCWLRRKRSETELASLAGRTSVDSPLALAQSQSPASTTTISALHRRGEEMMPLVPDLERTKNNATTTAIATNNNKFQTKSIWDHALLEPEEARQAIDRRLSSASSSAAASPSLTQQSAPWAWRDDFLQRADPIPSVMTSVARFLPPRMSYQQQSWGNAPPGTSSAPLAADIACGMEWEEHGWLFATAGISKQVRIYSLASYLSNSSSSGYDAMNEDESNATPMVDDEGGASQGPVKVHRLASKLSSLAWNPDQPGVVTVGDYDGVVVQLDLESGHLLSEQDEHGGRRVWSVSHSHLRPHLAASGSEDGTVALWSGPNLRKVAARVSPAGSAAITGVQLSPFDENALAVACADCCAYIYDLRQLRTPVVRLHGHSRPVSYVKYLGISSLITAATDATVAAWDLPAGAVPSSSSSASLPVVQNGGSSSGGAATTLNTHLRTFTGHVNSKNFVGLAVRPEDRLIACGSETHQAFAYSMAWDSPVVSYDFSSTASRPADNYYTTPNSTPKNGPAVFCSAVAWQPVGAAPGCGPLLAAATSDGEVKILGLRQLQEQ